MFRIIASVLVVVNIFCNMSAVFAESGSGETDSDIMYSECFTADNVIYAAMQENIGEATLFSTASSDDNNVVTADFNVVLGFDMSLSM